MKLARIIPLFFILNMRAAINGQIIFAVLDIDIGVMNSICVPLSKPHI